MHRMFLENINLCAGNAEPLTIGDCAEIEQLYKAGESGGTAFGSVPASQDWGISLRAPIAAGMGWRKELPLR